MAEQTKTEISEWLKAIFGIEFNIEIEGKTEKGDGYLGDIVFVQAQNQDVIKHLVLKCSKKNNLLREKVPIKETFTNEIYMYGTIFPAFKSFEQEHGITAPFNNIPQFYGSFVADSTEMLVLENLKNSNHFLHDRKVPLTKEYIELVMEAYGHFHAISAAFKDQQPEKFQRLCSGLVDVYSRFVIDCHMDKLMKDCMDECYDVLKGEIAESYRDEWKRFSQRWEDILNIVKRRDAFAVITHADCWNNNFMFKGEESCPDWVTILDWQISLYCSPIIDLSYFLFACLSNQDLKNIDGYLKCYYDSFSRNVRQMGSDPDKIYSYSEFRDDWTRFGRYGVTMGVVNVKATMVDKEDCKDMEDALNEGFEVADTFKRKVKDQNRYMLRMKELVQYSVDNGLIKVDDL